MKISIGSDHAGFEYKEYIKRLLKKEGYTFIDRGASTADSVDYPDFAHPVAQDIEKNMTDFGILVCGSGNGVCITANKHAGIRAALCWTAEIAQLARLHNDANILCIPARFVSKRLTSNIVKQFLNTGFEGGRHQNRVNKIACV
ncbi:MAG: ribose 5-phosphate isomerase B [Saprospiraceae bacterium]|jgi:ribose 5-phosphate isomerase B|nr:ribose 5-phosphate isomerase B [Saprospiraceae bacterium]MBK9567868.1 ribose 5-phosphate isomerase B [Saprospiraceae bacterium]MBP6445700.1 ribose 5-phosphate isomerase B [Saprospiraceae bacterium]